MIKTFIFRALSLLVLSLLFAGCEPITPEDRAFFEEQDLVRAKQVEAMRAANANVTTEDVLRRVRQYTAPTGKGTMQEWLTKQIEDMRGQVMFSKWETDRRGSSIQNVSYSFMHIGPDGRVTRYRYNWEIDVINMTVSDPVLEELEQMESREDLMRSQQLRRVEEYEQELM